MTFPVSYLELNRPDLPSTARFVEDVISWELQPFASPTTSSLLTAPRRALTAECCPRATVPRERSDHPR
jgi:hypothetical protein